jgi:hypothetical protein
MRPLLAFVACTALLGCTGADQGLRSHLTEDEFASSRSAFLVELQSVAGANAVDCGFYSFGNDDPSSAIDCMRQARELHRPFVVADESRAKQCPQLVGYAGDSHGRVFFVHSCPDRDSTHGAAVRPAVEECPEYKLPTYQFGDGQCSVLDSI